MDGWMESITELSWQAFVWCSFETLCFEFKVIYTSCQLSFGSIVEEGRHHFSRGTHPCFDRSVMAFFYLFLITMSQAPGWLMVNEQFWVPYFVFSFQWMRACCGGLRCSTVGSVRASWTGWILFCPRPMRSGKESQLSVSKACRCHKVWNNPIIFLFLAVESVNM